MLLEKGAASRFLDKGEDSTEVAKLIERLREAITHYQVSENYLVVLSTTHRRADITTTSDLRSGHQPHCEDFPVCLSPALTIGPFIKSSFNTLLKLHEVIQSAKSVAMFTDTGAGVPSGEKQTGFCYRTVGSAMFRGGWRRHSVG